jgi:hypothetical protein
MSNSNVLSSSVGGPEDPSPEPETVMSSSSGDKTIVPTSSEMLSESEVGDAGSSSLVNIKTIVVVEISISTTLEVEDAALTVGVLPEPEVIGESRGASCCSTSEVELSITLVGKESNELDDTSTIVEGASTLWLGASAMIEMGTTVIQDAGGRRGDNERLQRGGAAMRHGPKRRAKAHYGGARVHMARSIPYGGW